jgi:hypothetical protein
MTNACKIACSSARASFVKVYQPQHQWVTWSKSARDGWYGQIATNKGTPGGGEIITRH